MKSKARKMTAESKRLKENTDRKVFWKKWGPYLSERQWGTVREDYSATGEAWEYFPHDHARSRAYRWGEDGIAGISDYQQNLCFSIALWNGNDPIMKERLFGLTGNEGNHGEDVKELYYYLDNTPTHSYMKYLYKYPHAAYPYKRLVNENKRRSKADSELELIDTGVFDNDRYFDVFVEYAKSDVEDIVIKITICNRGEDTAPIDILPTLWFRNTWSFGKVKKKPVIKKCKSIVGNVVLKTDHEEIGKHFLYCQKPDSVLFTENETNTKRLYNMKNACDCVKDAFHEVIVDGKEKMLSHKKTGSKAAPAYHFDIKGGGSEEIILRLSNKQLNAEDLAESEKIVKERILEADQFYRSILPENISADLASIQRQAFAGILWNKQYYNYELETWQQGDEGQPPPPESRKHSRNYGWEHLFNRDVISMPDKWEYPWYATWDLAFQCLPLAMIDPDFAKEQLLLFLREWYMHPNGQLPAYEWALGDVNPPVHAWACLRVYQIEKDATGHGDFTFLKRVFHKLLLNFTWWVNRKDADGNNIFQGGFLGLDNIGIFDRSQPLPTGGHLEQADGTSWMAMYSLNMMVIALELSSVDVSYEDMASKFFEHFVHIAEAFNGYGGDHVVDLWDDKDGFFYDAIHFDSGKTLPLKTRSLVGLIPLVATCVMDVSILDRFPNFAKRLNWFRDNRRDMNKQLIIKKLKGEEKILFSLVQEERLVRILSMLLCEKEFLAPGGIRSLSKYHKKHPFSMKLDSGTYSIAYEPGESKSSLFGGNSNWRGPVWMPINYLIVDSLKEFAKYFNHTLKVEYPLGSGHKFTLHEVANELSMRIIKMFMKEEKKECPVHTSCDLYADNPYFKDLLLFYEYFHGDDSRGLGASHQTGWSGLVANLIDECFK
jgi:hypothetical protein